MFRFKSLKIEVLQFFAASLLSIILSLMIIDRINEYNLQNYYNEVPYLPIKNINFQVIGNTIRGSLTLTKIHECKFNPESPHFFKWIGKNTTISSEVLRDSKVVVPREILKLGVPTKITGLASYIPDEIFKNEDISFVSLNVVCDKGNGMTTFQLVPEMIYIKGRDKLETHNEEII